MQHITMAMPPAVGLCWWEAEVQRLSRSRGSIFPEELTPYGNHRQLKLQTYCACNPSQHTLQSMILSGIIHYLSDLEFLLKTCWRFASSCSILWSAQRSWQRRNGEFRLQQRRGAECERLQPRMVATGVRKP